MLFEIVLMYDAPSPTQIQMQGVLIEEFFQNIDLEVKKALTRGGKKPFRDICHWEYRQRTRAMCDQGLVVTIGIYDVAIGELRFDFLPPTVRNVDVMRCRQSQTLEVCRLPRCLQRIDFSGNLMCGSLDLAYLPERLERFLAPHNIFSGSITLRSLPRTLLAIDLGYNVGIGPQTLYVDNLPASLKDVSLVGTKVRAIVSIDESVHIPESLFKFDGLESRRGKQKVVYV